MTLLYNRLVGTLLVLVLTACGAGGADETRSDGDVAQQGTAGKEVRACDVLDVETAGQVIGSDTENAGGDTEQFICVYSNPGVATLTLQLGSVELYDQVTILEPHTSVQIGEKARYNVQETGVVAVQFAAGDHSATLSVQPIGDSETDYLEPLISAAHDR